MEGRYSLYSQGGSGWTSMRNEEFQEDDVWAVLKERKDFNSKVGTSAKQSSIFTARGLPTAARMIPRPTTTDPIHEPKILQKSAPLNIPDWSKIYGKHSDNAFKNKAQLNNDDDDNNDEDNNKDGDEEDDENEEDDDGNMMPPHEWIAKKLARSKISSFSVCEGIGRTLKGRDLSRVRNAVLTRTGFLE